MSAPINIQTLNPDDSQDFTFDFSQSPIPAGVTDLYLQVVFKGILGNETGNAVAVGMKDLNEPQHIILVNSTDRVYLDGQLHTAEEIRSDPDLDWPLEDSYLDPYNDMQIGTAFFLGSYPTMLHAACLSMQSATFGRIIILADEPSFYYHVQWASPSRGHSDYGWAPIAGVTNQENNEGGFDSTQVLTFRGIKTHFVRWVCWNSPDASGLESAPWPPMADEDPQATFVWP